MATAQTIIDRALRLIGAIESGESPTTQESTDALVALNAMLESWSIERLNIFAYQQKTFTLIPGNATITMGGTTPNINIRPTKIENLYVTSDGIDYPIEVIDQEEWYSISEKGISGRPSVAYYEPSYPQAILNLHPVPDAADVLTVLVWTPLDAFANVSTTVILPPGTERALAYNLAIEIAPEYQAKVSDAVAKVANESHAALKRANQRPMKMATELPYLLGQTTELELGQF